MILISAYDSIEDNNKLNFELLRKPVTLQKLLDIVNFSLNNNATQSLSARLDEYDVFGFTNPFLLLDYIHHHNNQFRLVLIDYKMPQITGCELVTEIADINSRIEMVLITAANDIVKNNLNLELILKPLKMYQLLQIVTKYMN